MRTYANEGRRMRGGSRSTTGIAGILTLLLFVWLIIGAVAAGPLNYLGMNPKIAECHVDVPQPST
ncbi:hypothetical protein [Nocardia sp. JMUB6875]|uniref:hypothetical protein n=1 Tax=Nocardia sp. JMUB6875 TaxID=3158170 RepID=UPI0034E86CFC